MSTDWSSSYTKRAISPTQESLRRLRTSLQMVPVRNGHANIGMCGLRIPVAAHFSHGQFNPIPKGPTDNKAEIV